MPPLGRIQGGGRGCYCFRMQPVIAGRSRQKATSPNVSAGRTAWSLLVQRGFLDSFSPDGSAAFPMASVASFR